MQTQTTDTPELAACRTIVEKGLSYNPTTQAIVDHDRCTAMVQVTEPAPAGAMAQMLETTGLALTGLLFVTMLTAMLMTGERQTPGTKDAQPN
jgi:hypothetical protein